MKNSKEMVRLYKLAANQGYHLAELNLAICYENGDGVEKNLNDAMRLYNLSAGKKYAAAQFNLARLYEIGKGAGKNDKEAIEGFATRMVRELRRIMTTVLTGSKARICRSRV